MTNQRHRNAGLLVAILFGVGNALLAVLLEVPQPIAFGVATFALVAAGAAITDLWTRRPVTAPGPPPETVVTESPPPVSLPDPREVSRRDRVPKQAVVLFVHGFLSSAQAWEPFERLIRADPDLDALELDQFQYNTKLLQLIPTRRIPALDTIARRLCTRFEELERRYDGVVIVSHSMGGLVTQRFVAHMLEDGQGRRLTRVKRIVMFACPTAGAEFLGTLRMLAPVRHNQEEVLRVLNPQITNLQQRILSDVVHAKRVDSGSCPIPLRLYAGETDNIVGPESALGVYPHACTGVVEGDHSTIIQPDSPRHESYRVLKNDLEIVLEALAASSQS